MAGWIKLHRQIQNHWIWEDSEKLKWWLDLILMANHQDNKVLINGKLITIEAGERHTSEEKLASRWGVSRNTVRKFLNLLVKDDMISVKKSRQNGTTYKVLNYNVYQGFSDEKKHQTEQRTEQQKDNGVNNGVNINKNDKEGKNEKNEKNIKDNSQKSAKRTYDVDSIYYQLASFLFQEIQKNNPEARKPNFNVWADEIRKMIDLDGRKEEQVRNMITWSQSNDFWKGIILSAKKLRDKYDQMKVQALQPIKQANWKQNPKKENLPDWANGSEEPGVETMPDPEQQQAIQERIARLKTSQKKVNE